MNDYEWSGEFYRKMRGIGYRVGQYQTVSIFGRRGTRFDFSKNKRPPYYIFSTDYRMTKTLKTMTPSAADLSIDDGTVWIVPKEYFDGSY